MHILSNSLSILILMSKMEISYGIWRTIVIFLVGGIGGNIFSALVSPYSHGLSAGASTSITAIIGCWLSFLILNWKGLENLIGKEARCMMTCMVTLITIIFLLLSATGGYGNPDVTGDTSIKVDNYGHLGGLLTGLLIGLFIPKPIEES